MLYGGGDGIKGCRHCNRWCVMLEGQNKLIICSGEPCAAPPKLNFRAQIEHVHKNTRTKNPLPKNTKLQNMPYRY